MGEPLLLELQDDDDFVTCYVSKPAQYCCECRDQLAQYTCPGCQERYCSLPCVKRHKVQSGCTGEHLSVQYVHPQELEKVFRKDIGLLDEIGRVVENSARISAKEFEAQLNPVAPPGQAKGSHKSALRKACRERGIFLRTGPDGFKLRESNTTRITRKSKKLGWKVLWKFPTLRLEHCSPMVLEDTLLSAAIGGFCATQQHKANHAKSPTLAFPVDDVEVLFQNQDRSQPWIKLDKGKSLCDNLRGKVVVEFPILYVIPRSEMPHYIKEQARIEEPIVVDLD